MKVSDENIAKGSNMRFSLNNHNGSARLAYQANAVVHNYPNMVRANWGYQA